VTVNTTAGSPTLALNDGGTATTREDNFRLLAITFMRYFNSSSTILASIFSSASGRERGTKQYGISS
jgi:hypothetical protein